MRNIVKMRSVLILSVVGLVLAGCAAKRQSNRTAYDGKYYNVRLNSDRGDRINFVVTVSDAAKGLAGAKEAGRHRAIKHCIKHYGTSAIDWTVGPETPDRQLQFEKGALTFAGKCVDER